MSGNALAEGWEEQAQRWIEWARKPGHDSYWRFHGKQFFELLPPPGKLTLDVGCGEGRVSRDLKALGHNLISIDVAPTLIKAAKEADPTGDYRVANANALPLEDSSADLVIAFMSIQDVDDLDGTVREMARVMKPGARACIAIVHPINSAGNFVSEDPDADFVIAGSCKYLGEFNYSDTFERDGLEMTFHSRHRSFERYSKAFERAGLVIEALREHAVPQEAAEKVQRDGRWQRLPLFLHMKLLKL